VTGKMSPGTGNGKNLFSVYEHRLGHSLGLLHNSIDKNYVVAPFHKHGFSTESKHEILSENDIKLLQEIYGKPKTVEMRAVLTSKKQKS